MANKLNFFRGEYSKFLELVENQQIVATNLYFTVPDATPKENDKKSSSFCVFHGTNLLASATHEADLNKVIGDVSALTERINNISSELATYTMSAITVDDKNVKEAYQLIKTVGETSEAVGDTIKVYNDSALNNVELISKTENKKQTQFLKFTYTLADGSSKEVEFDVSSLLVQSEFKNGLLVNENGEVSVKLGENITNSEGVVISKNFLTFEGNVDGEKALAVRSMDTDALVLHQPLTVAGLSGSFGAGNYENGDEIPSGTSIYTILENILCKESYPTTTAITNSNASVSMKDLTLTLDKSGDQEVGTLVKLTTGKTNGVTVTKTDPKISGMVYGFSVEAGKKQQFSNDMISASTHTSISSNTYTISATINNGFTADTTTNVKTTPTTVSGESSASLAETTLGCVSEGSNKITINATGATYSYSGDAVTFVHSGNTYDTFYFCSNLKKTDANHKLSRTATSGLSNTPTKSANTTITGKYKYFMGGSQLQDPKDLTSDAIRGLVKNGWVTKDGTTSIGTWQSPGYSVVIACPSKYKLATITDSMGNSYLGKFSKTATIAVKTGAINTNYTVYMYPLENNDKMDFKNITLTKA